MSTKKPFHGGGGLDGPAPTKADELIEKAMRRPTDFQQQYLGHFVSPQLPEGCCAVCLKRRTHIDDDGVCVDCSH